MHIIIVTLQTYMFINQLKATCSNNMNETSILRNDDRKDYSQKDFIHSLKNESEKDIKNHRVNKLKCTLGSSQNNNKELCRKKISKELISEVSSEKEFSKKVENIIYISMGQQVFDQNTSKGSINLYLTDHITDSNSMKFYQDEKPNSSQFPNNFSENHQGVSGIDSKLKNSNQPLVHRKSQLTTTSIDSTSTTHQNNSTDSIVIDAILEAVMTSSKDDTEESTRGKKRYDSATPIEKLDYENLYKQDYERKPGLNIMKSLKNSLKRPNEEVIINQNNQESPCAIKKDISKKQRKNSKGSDETNDSVL